MADITTPSDPQELLRDAAAEASGSDRLGDSAGPLGAAVPPLYISEFSTSSLTQEEALRRSVASAVPAESWWVWTSLGVIFGWFASSWMPPYLRALRWNKIRLFRFLAWISFLVIVFACSMVIVQKSRAATTGPQKYVYNGHLLRSDGTPVTTAHDIRFSEWLSSNMVAGDITATGSVNTAAAQYAGWYEVHTVTPDARGYFSVELGSVTALPDLASMSTAALASLFLQVEVKAQGQPDTSFETLDVDSSDAAVDRSPINALPFAQNADLLDQRDVGTGSGSIPFLGSGGLLPESTVPGGTYRDVFSIDSDDSATSSVALQFGQTLAKTLSYNVPASRFEFNDSLYIDGDLTVTGLVNGIDLSTLGPGGTGAQLVLKEFHAEYPNSAYKGDGSENVGQLIVTNDGSSLRNYYQWNSTRSSLQDYDIFVRTTLPQTFLRWKDNPLSLTYRSSTGALSAAKADIEVFDTSGGAVTLSGSVLDLNAVSWTTTQAEFTGSPAWTPGQEMVIRIRLFAKDLENMQIADLKLQYYTQ